MVIDDEAWLAEVTERAAMAREGLGDEATCRAYTEHATAQDIPRLVKYVRDLTMASGGDFGTMLRNALKSKLVSSGISDEGKKIATLHDDVKLLSMNVAIVGGADSIGRGQVIVDVRLRIGGP